MKYKIRWLIVAICIQMFLAYFILTHFSIEYNNAVNKTKNFISYKNFSKNNTINSNHSEVTILNKFKWPFDSFVSFVSKQLNLPVIPHERKQRILIISEARSGSSFIGDLLQQAWPSFYLFEPLRYLGDTFSKLNERDGYRKEAIRVLEKYFHCNTTSYFDSKLTVNEFKTRNMMIMKLAQQMPGFIIVNRNHPFRNLSNTKLLEKVFSYHEEICMLAKNIIIKEIRLPIKFVMEVVNELTNQTNRILPLRIIYLVRDPRGTMSSRKSPNLKFCQKNANCKNAKILCSYMRENMASFKELAQSKRNPSSLFTIHFLRFEDFSSDPMKHSHRLFGRLALPFALSTETWLKQHTNAKRKTDHFSTIKNSTSVILNWKETLSMKEIDFIQEECSDIMIELGYKKIVSVNNLTQEDTLEMNDFLFKKWSII